MRSRNLAASGSRHAYQAVSPQRRIGKLAAGLALAMIAAPAVAQTQGPEPEELTEVVITGTNLRGVTSLPTFMTSADREEIAATGRMTTEEYFATLPQNFAGVSAGGFRGDNAGRLSDSNTDRAAAIDLRGLGADSTLTLINGTRRAGSIKGRVVDVSTIPLSAIERIDVVTGGRSAVYGSDAVAGVVNIVTRKDFEGLEAQFSYGGSRHGGDRLQTSVIGGMSGESRGFVIAYDYTHEAAFDVVRAGLSAPTIRTWPSPPFFDYQDNILLRSDAQPRGERHSLYAAGHLRINEAVELYADGLLTRKTYDSKVLEQHFGGSDLSYQNDDFGTTNYNLKVGATATLGDWVVDASVSKSQVDGKYDHDQFFSDFFGNGDYSYLEKNKTDLSTATIIASGKLFEMGSFSPKFSFGAEMRWEDYRRERDGVEETDSDRRIASLFGEVVLPISEDAEHGLTKLDIFLGARYDDYSDFGSTFNPQIGAVWRPAPGLQIKGGASRAYRAPALAELGTSRQALIENLDDPASPSSMTPVILVGGDNSNLSAEKAKTWSVGFEYQPEFAPQFRVSAGYYNIDFKDRINSPAPGFDVLFVLLDPDRYPGLINRQPTDDYLNELLAGLPADQIVNNSFVPWDPATQTLIQAIPGLAAFDNRANNISTEKVEGIDFAASVDFTVSEAQVRLGVDGTYTLKHKSRLSATSPVVSRINQVGVPPDLRLHGRATVDLGDVVFQTTVNYVDSYKNTFTTPVSDIESWTTVDLNVTVDFADISTSPFFEGLTVSGNVENLFDKRAPFFDGSSAFTGNTYDPANASPFGRFVSVRLSKKW